MAENWPWPVLGILSFLRLSSLSNFFLRLRLRLRPSSDEDEGRDEVPTLGNASFRRARYGAGYATARVRYGAGYATARVRYGAGTLRRWVRYGASPLRL
jgi:hypothetical protein